MLFFFFEQEEHEQQNSGFANLGADLQFWDL
jgi:hypothetical protein